MGVAKGVLRGNFRGRRFEDIDWEKDFSILYGLGGLGDLGSDGGG
jgi:hypothetical protein